MVEYVASGQHKRSYFIILETGDLGQDLLLGEALSDSPRRNVLSRWMNSSIDQSELPHQSIRWVEQIPAFSRLEVETLIVDELQASHDKFRMSSHRMRSCWKLRRKVPQIDLLCLLNTVSAEATQSHSDVSKTKS
jgi:hypothetical protein